MKKTMIDTHAHLYSDEFERNYKELFSRIEKANVSKILLPNIDSSTIKELNFLLDNYPQCTGMMGLHPCSVKENYKDELAAIKDELYKNNKYKAVGEIGIDLYWDKTTQDIQILAFEEQCKWANELDLPIAIHTRQATYETIRVLKSMNKIPNGVFHCFSGSIEEANEIIKLGFYLGIGGVVTFKNSNLPEVLKQVPIERLVLETDSPYLSPVPYRGKRNESSYLEYIAEKLAFIYGCTVSEVIEKTTENAIKLFKL